MFVYLIFFGLPCGSRSNGFAGRMQRQVQGTGLWLDPTVHMLPDHTTHCTERLTHYIDNMDPARLFDITAEAQIRYGKCVIAT